MENNKKQQKKGGGLTGAIIWLLILAVGAAVRNGADSRTVIVYLVPIAIVVVIVAISTALNKKMQKNGRTSAAPTRTQAARSYSPEVAPRREAARREATRPEPTQVYNDPGDNSDTDRDRQRRRQQLDAFLRNGIIDRKEYMALLRRHEGRNR